MAISANISLPVLRRYLNRLGLVRTSEERTTAELYRRRLAIRAPSVDHGGSLSGGNQQKVMLGKWLNTQPSLLILDEPTRGVDVGAKAEVHAMIAELVAEGLGIMLIVRASGGADAQRSRPGHARRATDGDLQPRGGERGNDHGGSDGTGDDPASRRGCGVRWLQRHVR